MPPRIPRAIGRSSSIRLPISSRAHQTCPICSISRQFRAPKRSKSQNGASIQSRRQFNTTTVIENPTAKIVPKSSRAELRNALLNLQKHAAEYINISRLQLALRGLEQTAGQETIRVAILAIRDGGSSLTKARELLRLLVADPLKPEEEWERILINEAGTKPVLLKIGENNVDESIYGSRLVQELHVSSATLNGHQLEILLLETDPPSGLDEGAFTEALMVPTMEIPTSNTGRYTPVTTPVHKSLVVSEGVVGAAKLLGYPVDIDKSIIGAAVDLKVREQNLPIQVIDVSLGTKALESFRQSLDNAIAYEKDWFESEVPEILNWIKSNTAPTDGSMKDPLSKLIESLLLQTSTSIQAEQNRQLAKSESGMTPVELAWLQKGISQWAEKAHTELRDQLDIAFNGGRWRKLGWWKLFWRVDDVSMIASDILNQRFLTDTEKQMIFLSGRIAESKIFRDIVTPPKTHRAIEKNKSTLWREAPEPIRLGDLFDTPKDIIPVKLRARPWPIQIPLARQYLSHETVPALQALAQKLMLQTLSTSSFASILGGLMYVSSISTGLYEAGAVAAVGIVWSMRRMQGKWETARKFWEGEVREEGRKAIRGDEKAMVDVLMKEMNPVQKDDELEKAREAVEKAEAALVNCNSVQT